MYQEVYFFKSYRHKITKYLVPAIFAIGTVLLFLLFGFKYWKLMVGLLLFQAIGFIVHYIPMYIVLRRYFGNSDIEISSMGIYYSGNYFKWALFNDVKLHSFFGYKYIRFFKPNWSWRSYLLPIEVNDLAGMKYAIAKMVPDDITYKAKLLDLLRNITARPSLASSQLIKNYDPGKQKKKNLIKAVSLVVLGMFVFGSVKYIGGYEDFLINNPITKRIFIFMINADVLDGKEEVLGVVWPQNTEIYYKLGTDEVSNIVIKQKGEILHGIYPPETTFSVSEGEIYFSVVEQPFELVGLTWPAGSYVIFKNLNIDYVRLGDDWEILGNSLEKDCVVFFENNFPSKYCENKIKGNEQ